MRASDQQGPHSIRVGIYCDLGARTGAGHFVRCLALGSALHSQGMQVTMASDFSDVDWAEPEARAAGLATISAASPAVVPTLATDWHVTVVDSYIATASDFADMPTPLVAIDDEALRPLPAQLIINQNLSAAELDYSPWWAGSTTPHPIVLRGPRFALLRDQFREHRPAQFRPRGWEGQPRVLVLLGGTDAHGLIVPLATRVLAELPPVDLTAIAPEGAIDQLRGIAVPAGSTLTASGPVTDIAALMDRADLVVSAAGTTVWELCCLGVPMALITVAANQDEHYAHAIQADIAVGLGTIRDTLTGRATEWDALRDPTRLNACGERAFQLCDGRGAQRAAAAIQGLVLEQPQG